MIFIGVDFDTGCFFNSKTSASPKYKRKISIFLAKRLFSRYLSKHLTSLIFIYSKLLNITWMFKISSSIFFINLSSLHWKSRTKGRNIFMNGKISEKNLLVFVASEGRCGSTLLNHFRRRMNYKQWKSSLISNIPCFIGWDICFCDFQLA